jgi:hypothetical protein
MEGKPIMGLTPLIPCVVIVVLGSGLLRSIVLDGRRRLQSKRRTNLVAHWVRQQKPATD